MLVSKWKKLSKKQKAIYISAAVGIVLAVIFLAVWLVWSSMMSKVNLIDPDTETVPEEYDLPTESLFHPIPEVKGVTNILLLGIDARDRESIAERSDAMMILTIDQGSGKIKLTSLQRDMLVYLPGKDNPVKINSVNVEGGPALAMRVVNDTLRLNIKNYVIVNMQGLEELIDLVGGVMIDVQANEVAHINSGVADANRFSNNYTSDGISGSGLQKLNGRQAVAYSRIRVVGSDYARMGRQRTVLQAMLDSFAGANIAAKTGMITEGLEYISTNLTQSQIMDLGVKTLPLLNTDIEQLQIPIDGYFREYSGNQWVNLCDFNGMIPLLQEFIWGRTYDFDPVKEIAGAPNSSLELVETTRRTTTAETTVPSETTTEMTTTAETTTAETTTEATTTTETTTEQTASGSESEETTTTTNAATSSTTSSTESEASSTTTDGENSGGGEPTISEITTTTSTTTRINATTTTTKTTPAPDSQLGADNEEDESAA
jgi:LCP family protein required for cell wall assembly